MFNVALLLIFRLKFIWRSAVTCTVDQSTGSLKSKATVLPATTLCGNQPRASSSNLRKPNPPITPIMMNFKPNSETHSPIRLWIFEKHVHNWSNLIVMQSRWWRHNDTSNRFPSFVFITLLALRLVPFYGFGDPMDYPTSIPFKYHHKEQFLVTLLFNRLSIFII